MERGKLILRGIQEAGREEKLADEIPEPVKKVEPADGESEVREELVDTDPEAGEEPVDGVLEAGEEPVDGVPEVREEPVHGDPEVGEEPVGGTQEFQVTVDWAGERLDKVLSAWYGEGQSRSFFQKLIKNGQVQVNGCVKKANYGVNKGDFIQVEIPAPKEIEILPENIPLDILYEDLDLLVVNKPKGMVVHPSAGHSSGTLVNAVMYHCRDSLSGINGTIRPGIVHRIDMDTTGALIVCKNDSAHLHIAEQIKAHSVTRRYLGIVKGIVREDRGTVEGTIGRHPSDRKKMAANPRNGKRAVTHYRVLQRFSSHTYVEFELETGRTHQIRVHMASIGHPLLGDSVYGNGKSPWKLQGQTLHAAVIGFVHPSTGEYVEVSAPLPEYFADLLRKAL